MSRKARKTEKPDEPSHIIGVAAHGVHVEGSKLFPCAQCGLPVQRQVAGAPLQFEPAAPCREFLGLEPVGGGDG